jgi:hypothetical protein
MEFYSSPGLSRGYGRKTASIFRADDGLMV